MKRKILRPLYMKKAAMAARMGLARFLWEKRFACEIWHEYNALKNE